MAKGIPAERLELLRRFPLFQGLDDDELARVDGLVDDIEVPPGEVLTREGEPGKESFMVLSGEAEVTIRGEHVATLGPGSFFGEMAMIDFQPRSATITARTPMSLFVIGPASFSTFLGQPGVTRKLLRGLVERLRAVETGPAA